jgi:ubiquitin-conjugating enzyme (huntingtin interacting protein 2)
MTLRITLMSIQALLDAPDASSPQDYQVAKVYTADKQAFDEEARLWTRTYANVSLEDYVG